MTKEFTRNFGFLLAAIFAALSLRFFYLGFLMLSIVLATITLLIAIIAFKRPEILSPLSRLWALLGELVGVCTRPLIMGALFYLIFTPVAILARMIRGDGLVIKKTLVSTYWVNAGNIDRKTDQFRKQY